MNIQEKLTNVKELATELSTKASKVIATQIYDYTYCPIQQSFVDSNKEFFELDEEQVPKLEIPQHLRFEKIKQILASVSKKQVDSLMRIQADLGKIKPKTHAMNHRLEEETFSVEKQILLNAQKINFAFGEIVSKEAHTCLIEFFREMDTQSCFDFQGEQPEGFYLLQIDTNGDKSFYSLCQRALDDEMLENLVQFLKSGGQDSHCCVLDYVQAILNLREIGGESFDIQTLLDEVSTKQGYQSFSDLLEKLKAKTNADLGSCRIEDQMFQLNLLLEKIIETENKEKELKKKTELILNQYDVDKEIIKQQQEVDRVKEFCEKMRVWLDWFDDVCNQKTKVQRVHALFFKQ